MLCNVMLIMYVCVHVRTHVSMYVCVCVLVPSYCYESFCHQSKAAAQHMGARASPGRAWARLSRFGMFDGMVPVLDVLSRPQRSQKVCH